MQVRHIITLLILSSIFQGCSKDSAVQTASSIQTTQNNESSLNNQEVNFERTLHSSVANLLLQKGQLPSAESVDYYSVQSEILEDKTISLMVSALVLDLSDKSQQDFYTRLNNVSEIKIVADKIIISKELSFPGINILIKANELVFKGKGRISTRPTGKDLIPDFGSDGKAGKAGGNVVLDVKTVDLGEAELRFDLSGGDGQDAGHAKPGSDGRSVNVIQGNIIKQCITEITNRCPGDEGGFEDTISCTGTDLIPTSGTDARPSGLPGVGGDGGNLVLPASIVFSKNVFKSHKGTMGAVAPVAPGGKAGQPSIALQRNITRTNQHSCRGGKKPTPNRVTQIDIQLATTSAGKDSILRTIPDTAKEGKMSLLEAPLTDLEYQGKKNIHKLEFAKDLFRNNYFSEARVSLNEIISELEQRSNMDSEKFLLGEVQALLHLLNTNRDINGMLVNQMPVLSFESSLEVYKNSVTTSLETIAFAQKMKKNILSVEEKIEALKKNKEQIGSHIDLMSRKYADAYAQLPKYELKLADLENSKVVLEETLARVEAQIVAEANRNIHSQEKKKKLLGGLKLIAKLASVSPLGAPAAQVIGKSLDTLIDLSQDKEADWKKILADGYNVYEELSDADWKQSHASWNEKYKELDIDIFVKDGKVDKRKFLNDLKKINKTTQPLREEILKYYKTTYNNKVPRDAYEAEINRIKSIHPLFKELTNKLAELQENKAELDNLITQMTSDMALAQAEIIKDYGMLVSLDNQESDIKDGLNFSTDEILSRMEKNARIRLEKYKATLIKAYVYRTLMPYPGNLSLEKINAQLIRFAKASGSELAVTDLAVTYEEDLAEVSNALYDFVQNGNFKEFESEMIIDFNQAELQALSQGKTFYIDLAKEKEFLDGKENVRVISIELDEIASTEFTSPNLELVITHTGESVLEKTNRAYAFSPVSENQFIWMTRINLATNETKLIEESNNNFSLISAILGKKLHSSDIVFNQVGAIGLFAVKLKKAEGVRLSKGSLRIKYSYSIKN